METRSHVFEQNKGRGVRLHPTSRVLVSMEQGKYMRPRRTRHVQPQDGSRFSDSIPGINYDTRYMFSITPGHRYKRRMLHVFKSS